MNVHAMIKKVTAAGLVLAVVFFHSTAYAGDPLLKQDDDPSGTQVPTVVPTDSLLVPVTHSTRYDAQFSQYASFMKSPYTNSNKRAMQAGFAQGPDLPVNPALKSAADPYGASEVSPFSHYSPYMEIVGENSKYILGIDDVVTIVVRDQPDFSGRFAIDPEGNIQYTFVGDIKADGKTKGQLKADIVNGLKKYIRNPEVAVMISEYRSKAVYVIGYVNNPGKFAMKGDQITVKDAVVAAGLPRMDAATKRVYVVRPGKFNADGKPTSRKINLKKLLQKGESAQDFVLQPGDTIVVDRRYFDIFVDGYSKIVGPVFQTAAVYELGWGDSNGGFFRSDK
ncbi:MAG TPA: polysaccharide biosynthesis/export family protein [Candidatus Omnitrophota bacterium]|nr:polysaccharide biosynthesis/export family protein [Candidatus Omnitrophota bacterium]